MKMTPRGIGGHAYFLSKAKNDASIRGARRAFFRVAHKDIHRNCELLRSTYLSLGRYAKPGATSRFRRGCAAALLDRGLLGNSIFLFISFSNLHTPSPQAA
jgi:hypothetical protein